MRGEGGGNYGYFSPILEFMFLVGIDESNIERVTVNNE